jgi:hypothetical protein
MSHSTLTQTADSPSDSSRDSLAIVTAKFLLPSAAGTVAWVVIMASVTHSADATVGEPEGLTTAALVVAALSVLAPVYIYRTAPRTYVDSYHSLGVQLTMFVSVNVIITMTTLALWVGGHLVPLGPFDTGTPLTAMNAIVLTLASSILLPGPYAGALIGRWWSN